MVGFGESTRTQTIFERTIVGIGLAAGGIALAACTANGPSLPDIHFPGTKTTANHEVKGLPAGTKIYRDYKHGKLQDHCATLSKDVPLGDLSGPDPNRVDEFLYHQPGLEAAIGNACEGGGKLLYAEPKGSTVGAPQP